METEVTISSTGNKSTAIVEQIIQQAPEELTTKQLNDRLPIALPAHEFKMILKSLEQSKKILIDGDGAIVWIWNPQLLQQVRDNGMLAH